MSNYVRIIHILKWFKDVSIPGTSPDLSDNIEYSTKDVLPVLDIMTPNNSFSNSCKYIITEKISICLTYIIKIFKNKYELT